MAGELQPLDQQFAIVDGQGRPTLYFTKWAQQRQIDIGDSITLADLATYLAAHKLIAGTGIQITPDGDLANTPTIHADVQAILDEITATRGAMLYRGLLGWAALLPGTAGFVLSTAGAGADPLWIAAASGGSKAALGSPEGQLSTAWTPAVNNYLMKWIVADSAFTINKIAFMATIATPTAKFQPFVYASPAAPAGGGALLGSGPQVTGAVAGYNEVPLTTPVVVAKGQVIWIGVTVITAALNMTAQAGGMYGFAANGGSSVPANPCPALTVQNVANQIYGFWGV